MSSVFQAPAKFFRFVLKVTKTALIFVVYVLFMLVFVTPGAFIYLKCGRRSEKKKENLHRFICWSARVGTSLLGLFGNKFTFTGRTDEDFSRPAVITCNHQSHLDLLAMLALTPKLVLLTADWVWHNPLYGFIIREADFLPASNGIEANAPLLRELVKKGYSIAIYPESTRSMDCSIGRFHQGAFYLADQFNIDILPVILYGAGQALPKHGRLLNRGPIRLEIDGRISPEEMKLHGDNYRSRASYLRKYYISRYKEIAEEVEQTPRISVAR